MATNLDSPSHGHLGTAWEVAVVVVFIILIVALAAAAAFQMRRRQRRKRQPALARRLDVERGREEECSTNNYTGTTEEKCPDRSHSGASANDDSEGVLCENVKANRSSGELAQPSPTAQPKRLSKSPYHEYISKKPPKYYWDQR